MVGVEDGQLVTGTVVKVDMDEVLLDIGYKSEGVIPSRELSIRNDVDPHEVVSLGDELEALVLQKEDKEGRLLLSKKRAQYERAWGKIEEIKEAEGMVAGPVIEVVKGGLIIDIGLRGFLPASLVELRRVRDLQPYVGKTIEAKIIELDKNRNNVVLSRRAWLEETQKEQREDFLVNLRPGERPQGRRVVGRQLRCVRRPRRHGRSRPRVRAVVEARRPPERRRRGRRRDRGRGARGRHGPRAHLAVAQGDAAGSVAGVRRRATRWASWSTAGSPSSCRSVRSSRSATASRASSTSRRCRRTTSTCPSRSSRQAKSCGSRSSTSTSSVDGSRLSIKQAAEGGIVAAEYQEHFGEHNYDAEGNYVGPAIEPGETTEAQEAWYEEYGYTEAGEPTEGGEAGEPTDATETADATDTTEADAVEPSDAVADPADSVEAAEPVEAVEPVDAAETAEPVDAAEPVE